MFNVNKEKCIGCSQCVKDCPVSAISLNENKAEINNTTCFKCGHCIAICPVEAVSTDDYNMEEVIPYDKAKFTVDVLFNVLFLFHCIIRQREHDA